MQGGRAGPRERPRVVQRGAVQLEAVHGGSVAGRRRPGPVRGEGQGRDGGDAGTGLRQPGAEGLVVQALPLARRVGAVLQREWSERRGEPGRERLVEGSQVAEEHVRAPSVRRDVVKGGHQPVLRLAHPQQVKAEERAGVHVEPLGPRPQRQAPRLAGALVRRERRQVGQGERDLRRGEHPLHGFAAARVHNRAQGPLPPHRLLQHAAEDAGVQGPVQRVDDGLVEAAAGAEPLQAKKALLRQRQGKDPVHAASPSSPGRSIQ